MANRISSNVKTLYEGSSGVDLTFVTLVAGNA
jgi:hypothetical protein